MLTLDIANLLAHFLVFGLLLMLLFVHVVLSVDEGSTLLSNPLLSYLLFLTHFANYSLNGKRKFWGFVFFFSKNLRKKKRSSHVFHDDDNSSIKNVSFISSGNLPSFIIAQCPQSWIRVKSHQLLFLILLKWL